MNLEAENLVFSRVGSRSTATFVESLLSCVAFTIFPCIANEVELSRPCQVMSGALGGHVTPAQKTLKRQRRWWLIAESPEHNIIDTDFAP
jgi:hypothetical protein